MAIILVVFHLHSGKKLNLNKFITIHNMKRTYNLSYDVVFKYVLKFEYFVEIKKYI